MSISIPTVSEEQSAFYEHLGRCIAQWSHVEDGLYELHAIAINRSNEPRTSNLAAQAGYFAVQTPEGKLNVTGAAVHFRLREEMSDEPDDPKRRLLGMWWSLRKRVEKRRTRRNQIAHFQVLNSLNNKPGRRVELRPAIFNPNALLRKVSPLYCEQLKAIARSFGRTSFDLGTFAYGLAVQLNQQGADEHSEHRMQALYARIGDRDFPTGGFAQ